MKKYLVVLGVALAIAGVVVVDGLPPIQPATTQDTTTAGLPPIQPAPPSDEYNG